ncbi:hypothetical protein [Treponema sp.]|uniref:hypothetical protein n=1 Tax=Treponema sp. TaxID=166 RepID=UPI0025F1F55C|nr:hypothetical protein [Treponema sp.]MBR4321156.1 hypothetical protein [Treponema sp.]
MIFGAYSYKDHMDVVREEAREDASIDSAKNLLKMNLGTPEQISQAVSLPLEQVLAKGSRQIQLRASGKHRLSCHKPNQRKLNFLGCGIKKAAHTLVNRLVIFRKLPVLAKIAIVCLPVC